MERGLNGMTEQELRQWSKDAHFPAFRGSQLFHFFHMERGRDFSESSNLPKDLLTKLSTACIRHADVDRVFHSEDGSAKYLLRFADGSVVESVYMPYSDRNTICVSSQVGCRMGCTFCASTKAPFRRSLLAEEILEQVYTVEREEGRSISRIVLMGIGEPLDNYDEVLRFIRLVSDPKGKNLSQRHITLSTCGLIPGIRRLMEEDLAINLAISLHATSDARRARTMPIAKKYSISDLLSLCAQYFEKTGRRVSFEYALIAAENDRAEDIDWVSTHLRGAGFHVNLIPLNEIEEYDGKRTSEERMRLFAETLAARGVQVSVRRRRGADIDAACGQLRALYEGIGGKE